MKIHNDPVAKRLAREFDHKKDYDRDFTRNIKAVLQKVEAKHGRKIAVGTVIHWMTDGPGHRYPDPDLLTMVGNILGYEDVWDFYVTDKYIRADSVNPVRAKLIKMVLVLEERLLKPLVDFIGSIAPQAVVDEARKTEEKTEGEGETQDVEEE